MGGSASVSNKSYKKMFKSVSTSTGSEDKYAQLREQLCSPPPSPVSKPSRLDQFYNTAYTCQRCREMGLYYNTTSLTKKPEICKICNRFHCDTHADFYHRHLNYMT